MIVTIMSTAWLWTNYPHLKVITASYSNDLSIEHTLKTRRIIESDWYKELFGESFKITTDQNEKSKYENDKSGDRRATSVGGTITGGGADIIIVDDPLKAQEANSQSALLKAWEWYSQTMFSRLNNQETGLRIVVMQRLHENDVAGMIIKSNMAYEVITIPAEISERVSPLELKEKYIDGLFFPKSFSKEVLENARNSLGSLQYAGQYLQYPAPAEGNMIKNKWLKYFTASEELLKLPRHFRSDTAYGKEGSDNTATICYSIFKGQVFIWNVWKANLSFPDFIKAYIQYVKSNGYTSSSRCYFEPKATGISVIQTLRQESQLNVMEGQSPKESKETRVSSASPSIEAGKVLLLSYSDWIDGFISEATMFPNAEHDDSLDVLTAIINEELKEEPLIVSFV